MFYFTREYDFSLNFFLNADAIYSIPSMDDIILKSISIQSFSLENIESATQQYKTLIGEGGFGSVYRGTLSDGQEVAVKVRSATSTQGTREFDNEVKYSFTPAQSKTTSPNNIHICAKPNWQ